MDGFQIQEMEIVTGAGHGGRVVGDAEQLQIFIFGGGDHLVHRIVSVTAGDGMRVYVEHINQNNHTFTFFERL